MHYREYAPAPALAALIRCYWLLSGGDEPSKAPPEPALPDGCPELIINLGDPFAAIDARRARQVQPLAMLVGQITGPFTVQPTGRVELLAVRFAPAGAALICDDLASVTNSWLALDQLPAAPLQAFARKVLAQPASDDEVVARLDAALLATTAERAGPDAIVVRAVQAIEASHGCIPLETLATSLGCTLRHLQRRFAVQVGISPKALARIRRFQRVFSVWRDDPRRLSRVAAECGYSDQSHLIRDFRELAGAAPAAFLASTPEFTQLFLPS